MDYSELEALTGLRYDAANRIMYGTYNGYKVIVYLYPTPYRLTFSVTNGGALQKDMFKDIDKKAVTFAGCQYFRLTVSCKSGLRQAKNNEYLISGLNYMTDYLSSHGFDNCSEMDGTPGETGVYYAAGAVRLLSQQDYERLAKNVAQQAEAEQQVKENIPMGTLGAVIGSLVGVAAIILLDRIGFIAAIGGTIMSYCAVFGYEKLGKKLSTTSKWIILAVIILMVVFANHLCWAISAYLQLKETYIVSFTQILDNLGDLLSSNELWGRYFLNLGMIMVFTLLGGFPLLNRSVNSVIDSKKAYVIQPAPAAEYDYHRYDVQ